MKPLPAEYSTTTYQVFSSSGDIAVHIDQRVPELRALVGECPWVIVTAYNPAGRRLSPEDNQARNQRLAGRLAGRNLLRVIAIGSDPSWNEHGYLVAEMTECDGQAIAVEFGQNAIVCGSGGAAPRLVDCRTES